MRIFRCNFAKFSRGHPPDTSPKDDLWRHTIVTKLGPPLGNFLRTPLHTTTTRGPDIFRNVMVSEHVTFHQINKCFANILFFHYYQNVFAGGWNRYANQFGPQTVVWIPLVWRDRYGARLFIMGEGSGSIILLNQAKAEISLTAKENLGGTWRGYAKQ